MTYASMSEFMRATVGPNWVIARRSPRIVAKYGEDVICLSQARYATLQALFDAQAPSPENAGLAMLAALQSIRVWLMAPDLSQDTLDHFAMTAAAAIQRAKEAGI